MLIDLLFQHHLDASNIQINQIEAGPVQGVLTRLSAAAPLCPHKRIYTHVTARVHEATAAPLLGG